MEQKIVSPKPMDGGQTAGAAKVPADVELTLDGCKDSMPALAGPANKAGAAWAEPTGASMNAKRNKTEKIR